MGSSSWRVFAFFAALLCTSCNAFLFVCNDGDTRLADGSNPLEGRVEICRWNMWGTVCDDVFGNLDARVVCRSLGYSNFGATAFGNAFFGAGDGPIHIDNAQCAGTENNLLNCTFERHTGDCDHLEDASVRCVLPTTALDCEEGDIRLSGTIPSNTAGTSYQGRVEVCANNVWGTVCDDLWTGADANVACRQLGFAPTGAIARRSAYFGAAADTVPIHIDNVGCIGTESRLYDCTHNGIGVNNCNHGEDAGVTCRAPTCVENSVRLVGGNFAFQGRVEICYDGDWGTICDDQWNQPDAAVVCGQLGFSRIGAFGRQAAFYGQGTGDIIFDNVRCQGDEEYLALCLHNGVGEHNCDHSEDASVVCPQGNTDLVCKNGDLRLVGGLSEYEGRVEVCIAEEWGTVCDNGWTQTDAIVVCRQLGYLFNNTAGVIAYGQAFFGVGTGPIQLTDVNCDDTKDTLLSCELETDNTCMHSEDAGVACPGPIVTCTDGDIRLVGGVTPFEGRVEYCSNTVWGTVCDDAWGQPDSIVACRQLGFSTHGVDARCCSYFGQGTGPIFLDNVACIGNEENLDQCGHNGIGVHNCGHTEDAAVNCGSACLDGDIRLVAGMTPLEGRVEVCMDEAYGTVCDDGWGAADANVVCRQLGYAGTGAIARGSAFFGAGTGTILLDDVACSGTETSLTDCTFTAMHNCVHAEDAGVTCMDVTSCTNGDIRLVGGSTPLEGRVEVCNNNAFGTVCDDAWGNIDATVVCRQLGFLPNGAAGFPLSPFGQGTGAIVLDNVACVGTEQRLVDCPNSGLNVHNCQHFEDAGARCFGELPSTEPAPVCLDGEIRLVGGAATIEGRVEVCDSNAWGTVCDDFWSTADANVACRQLGFADSGSIVQSQAFYGQGTGNILLDNLFCSGTEERLVDCVHNGIGTHNCAHSEDAGVQCRYFCSDGEIRLVNGVLNDLEGRVEICFNQAWGTVCDDFWSVNDANVACRQLGYAATGATTFSFAFFGQGTGDILLDNLFCAGTEQRLVDCPHNGVSVHNCAHSEDAGLRCSGGCTAGDIRLVSGLVPFEGRVEVCSRGSVATDPLVWGTVCDDAWSLADANVACRQLGYNDFGATRYTVAAFGQGVGLIALDNLFCAGTEARLVDCPHNGEGVHNCAHSEDAGVVCGGGTTEPPTQACQDWDLRLADGPTEYAGRLEVCLDEAWGTVCDDFWDDDDATVVCRQLGYSDQNSRGFQQAFYGQGTGQILVDNVMCTGNEPAIQNCTLLLTHNCVHAEDASVMCEVCSDGQLRLVNGDNEQSGRVEVCFTNTWGTVCDDAWGALDSRVACAQLGFSRFNSVPVYRAAYGQGTGPIYLDNLICSGLESRLVDCTHNGVGTHNCLHSEDAGVLCVDTLVCNHGAVRLVDGMSDSEGRVEVCFNEEWGTICDDGWDDIDANLVCGALGYSRFNATAVPRALFGQGSGPILIDDVACTGTESNILLCDFDNNTLDCNHVEDAGVICSTTPFCEDGELRLVGGTTEFEGRVEVCDDETWGTVCDDFWGAADANVACGQLGFQNTGAVSFSFAFFGQGTGPIFLDNLFCTGTEARLVDCPHNGIGIENCIHAEDAGVRCQAPAGPCGDGDVRLVGGTSDSQGRVEVCMSEVWGTVCDDFWGVDDAIVVCRQLGYAAVNATAHSFAFFGQGSGPIYLDDLMCTGDEGRLVDCPATTQHNCNHFEDAGVTCQECINGDIRLVNGLNERQGRVEVCANRVWGTVCDDFWGVNDATVACRQLGHSPTGAIARSFAFFGQGTGPIVLDDLFCVGTEASLFDCPFDPTHNCAHSEDAGVECMERLCETGDLRLANGNDTFGRLEVCMSGVWGTVCDDFFNDTDASVACRGLGFSRFDSYVLGNMYGPGVDPIYLDDVQCTGVEPSLLDCPAATTHNCQHFEDVSIGCKAELLCTDAELRLVDGSDQFEGRVEICFNETWGSICDGLWSVNDGNVACRQLGFGGTGAITFNNAFFGEGNGPIYLDDFLCTGSELQLIDCTNGGFDNIDFCNGHADDAGVRCPSDCVHGELRLAGGSNDNEGRLEVCLNSVWGTVCDDGWGTVDAQVACNQLGFATTGATAFSFSFFGQGTGPIHLDDVACSGTEAQLIDCTFTAIDNCIHFEDAGVRCVGCQTGEIRLVGGTVENEGRVEFCVNNVWGTICDDFWGVPDATVVCRQLGWSIIGAQALGNAPFGQGNGQITLDNIACVGTEEELQDCPHNGLFIHNCVHAEDAGVRCGANPVCQTGEVRLQGGTTDLGGRLEFCQNEVWGTVCDDGFGPDDAGVVCNQLGYSSASAMVGLNFGSADPSLPILIDNLACTGNEDRLIDCDFDDHTADCTHAEDATVMCSGTRLCEDGEIRLADGATELEGRVEFCYDETWGTVCDGLWSTNDAIVACRQLGHSPSGAIPRYNAFYGAGEGPIWLDGLLCTGNEERLVDCTHDGIGNDFFCFFQHDADAGVVCQQGCTNDDIRLVGGTALAEGRVEVCRDQTWGTVCDDVWEAVDANVACRQLGFSGFGANATTNAFFGTGTGPIHLDNVECTGTELMLVDCNFDSDTTDCLHSEDAGAMCVPTLLCNDGEIRLAGSSIPGQGRVEICFNETWGTICSMGVDATDAGVACRQLGFSRMGAVIQSFGPGTGDVFELDSVDGCDGTEDAVVDCGGVPSSCTHTQDLGVICQGPPICFDGEIRIASGTGNGVSTGRVEVCLNEQWGTVCDDFWTSVDANVACGQLGFSRFGATSRGNAFFGQGTGPINFDDLACVGDESRLIDCPRAPGHNCAHSEDAGVECSTVFVCQDGDVRLVGGSNELEGRVEICYNEVWGTVCDDGWTVNDANVVCGQLGQLNFGATAVPNSQFGQGSGPVYLNNVVCDSTESSLTNCTFDTGDFLPSCGHLNDAGVMCMEACEEGTLRLVGGTNDMEGRVEVCFNFVWGTVCDDFWGAVDASVACKQLGFSQHNATAVSFAGFGQGSGPIFLDNVQCLGTEDLLIDCPYDASHNCIHFEDAGIRCQACSNGEVRLEGGNSLNEGRVEVCENQAWGTVCDDGWTTTGNNGPAVVCRELGFTGFNAIGRPLAFFGQGTGPILFDDVVCTGTEPTLFQCNINRNHNCVHAEDAGVTCVNAPPVCAPGALRLAGGDSLSTGRVEVCIAEQWGTVCANSDWGAEEASVACKQLGYSRHGATTTSDTLSGMADAGAPIYYDNFMCTGEEETLFDCPNTQPAAPVCTHADDAALTCNEDLLCENGDLRLVNYTEVAVMEGRVEVCWNETWGTVCGDFWSTFDANVACRQLGFAPSGAIPFYNAAFGPGIGPIILDGLLCSGDEQRLVDCGHDGIGNFFCIGQLQAAVGVRCQERCVDGGIRLVDGPSPYAGRIEVCKDMGWGTVCDDFWDEPDAMVACRQLGYPTFNVTARSQSFFGQGVGAIHLDDLECTGSESSLFDCTFDPTHNCVHFEDAGVECQPFVCNDGDIRLVGGANEMQGRVELCRNHIWGTVCDALWTSSDANVACRQAGFSRYNAVTVANSMFGSGTGPIYLGALECTGDEETLDDCVGGATNNCLHSNDAGAFCVDRVCEEGQIRLAGGDSAMEGRVEVCVNEIWSTICDDGWDDVDANVACGQLGFSVNSAQAVGAATFGPGTGPVVLTNVGCTANDYCVSDLLDCTFDMFTGVPCPHTQDAGVICSIREAFVTGVVAVPTSANSVFVTWQPPVEFCSELNGFNVMCSSVSSGSVTAFVSSGAATSITVDNLRAYTDYSCCVSPAYTDESEAVPACAAVRTSEAAPGRPLNPSSQTSIDDCSSVTFSWDAPPEDERNGVIRYYIVSVLAQDTAAMSRDVSTVDNGTSVTIPNLQCCTSHTFDVSGFTIARGMSTDPTPFRTVADFRAQGITVDIQVQGNSFLIGWTTPQGIVDQDVTQYDITVLTQCLTTGLIMDLQQMTFAPTDALRFPATNLSPFLPYTVRLQATICGTSVEVYNNAMVFTQTTPKSNPVIQTIQRSGPMSISVRWTYTQNAIQSEYYTVDYQVIDQTALLPSNQLSGSVQTAQAASSFIIQPDNDPQTIDALHICQAYNITVTAWSCAASLTSDIMTVDVYDPTSFAFSFRPMNTDCETWLATVDQSQYIDCLEGVLIDVLFSGRISSVSCFAASSFSCMSGREVVFQTTLVSTDTDTSKEQFDLLQRWANTGPTITCLETNVPMQIDAVNPTETPTVGPVPFPGWAIAVIIIVVILVILTIAAIFIIFAMRYRRRPKLPAAQPHSRMMEDQDDSRSRISSPFEIGIVENPLYTEGDTDEPTFAALKAKEAEAEFGEPLEEDPGKPGFSVNFEPPN